MRLQVIVMTAMCSLGAAAHSQNLPPPRPSPQDMQKAMDSAMGSMLPMVGRMSEAQLEAQLKVAAKPETAETVATFKKNLYDALRRKGFTADEALRITSSTPWPSVPSSGK